MVIYNKFLAGAIELLYVRRFVLPAVPKYIMATAAAAKPRRHLFRCGSALALTLICVHTIRSIKCQHTTPRREHDVVDVKPAAAAAASGGNEQANCAAQT